MMNLKPLLIDPDNLTNMPTLPKEIVDEIFTLDNRYKKIEDSEGKKIGEIHYQRRQEVRKLRFELMELLNHAEDFRLEDIKRVLKNQAVLVEEMEEKSRNGG